MKDLSEMSLKEKDKLFRAIIREYQRAILHLKVIEERSFYPKIRFDVVREQSSSYSAIEESMINHIEKKENLEAIIIYTEEVFKALPVELYQLIDNDYLHSNRGEWWVEFYSRSTYYRLRRRALDDVLYYLLK